MIINDKFLDNEHIYSSIDVLTGMCNYPKKTKVKKKENKKKKIKKRK